MKLNIGREDGSGQLAHGLKTTKRRIKIGTRSRQKLRARTFRELAVQFLSVALLTSSP
jgi:hypothetical protein